MSFRLFFIPLCYKLFVINGKRKYNIFIQSRFYPGNQTDRNASPPKGVCRDQFGNGRSVLADGQAYRGAGAAGERPCRLRHAVVEIALERAYGGVRERVFRSCIISLSLFLPDLPRNIIYTVENIVMVALQAAAERFQCRSACMVSERGRRADVELPHPRPQYRLAVLRTAATLAAQRYSRG